jgi:glycine cleavage system H protein
MTTIPPTLRYTPSHEWIRDEGDGTATIGITDFAQASLGDIVFVELPPAGTAVIAGEAVGVVESVKAASDIYAPLDGVVEASNGELETGPERVNADAYDAWFLRIRLSDPAQLAGLLDAAGYAGIVPQDS